MAATIEPRAVLAMREALVKSGYLQADAPPAVVLREIMRRLDAGPIETTPMLRPGFVEPEWLASLADVYQRAERAIRGEGPPVFATFSGPSQTGKSGLGEAAIARIIVRNPSAFVATLSYGSALTLPRSRRIRDDVRSLGVALREDSSAVEQWTTTAGGGLLATGVRGPVTGQPGLGLIDLDDPYKDAGDAESAAVNAELRDFIDAVVYTRLGARTSVVLKFARWAVNDVIGYVKERDKAARAKCARCLGDMSAAHDHIMWEHHNLPALDADGEPIPKIPGKDRAFYAAQRGTMEPSRWAALMMGEPRPREGRLFLAGAPTYMERPREVARVCIGVDFAYSRKTSADHNAAVVVARCDGTRPGYYVLDVVRRQCSLPEWAMELRGLRARYPAATMHATIGGTELGTIDALAAPPHMLRINATTARADKYSRAQPTASLWNGNEREVIEARARLARGELVQVPESIPRVVYLPEQASWDVSGFLDRTLDFTGADGGVDDEQDALVSAIDACGPMPVASTYVPPTGRAADWQPGTRIPRRHG